MMDMELYGGKKIGQLTLIEPTDLRERGYVVWRCVCDCGNIVNVSSKKLRRSTVLSCGCSSTYREYSKDIIGMRVGMLTVDYLSDVKNNQGRRLWHLTCDCGGERLLSRTAIKRGKSLSCGCKKCGRRVELTGKQFGDLTVLRATDNRNKKGSVMWVCKCKCGNIVELSEDSLVHGKTQSCGCRKKKVQKEINGKLHRMNGTCIERLGQKPARVDSKSGICGVHVTKCGSYRATIGLKNRNYYLGTYKTLEEAKQARMEAVERYHKPIIDAFVTNTMA